jgi:hypothetical protein
MPLAGFDYLLVWQRLQAKVRKPFGQLDVNRLARFGVMILAC